MHIDKIHDEELFNALIYVSNKISLKELGFKALRISNRCFKMKHEKWADAIDKKYSHLYPKYDMAVSLSMLLMAKNNSRNI